MTAWDTETIDRNAAADDLHIAPYRPDGATPGTPTWIWSVVVDNRLFVRAWNGPRSRWYRAVVEQRAGIIETVGRRIEVTMTPIDEAAAPELGTRIDPAYRTKYAGSAYLPPMVAEGPKAATVEITPALEEDRA